MHEILKELGELENQDGDEESAEYQNPDGAAKTLGNPDKQEETPNQNTDEQIEDNNEEATKDKEQSEPAQKKSSGCFRDNGCSKLV